MLFADFGSGEVLLSMLWFFLFFIWIWLLFIVFGDIIRSRDMGGWAKALWTIFIIVLPFLGIFIYLIVRGGKMQERAQKQAQEQEAQFRQYVQSAAGSGGGGGAADEIARLADLRDKGVISEEEFQQAKAKALS